MTAPRFVFQVAMEMGITDTPGPGDWTDLSDRILQCRGSRGRTTELDEFGVGSATVVLDNSDRMLDPSVAGALNELAADKGLPGCPAQLMIDWGGEVEWMVGVLGDEPWIPDDAPHGATGTVTVEIVDTMARDAQMGLPDDVVRAAMLSAGPDWWGRRFTNLGTFDDWSGNNDPGGFVWGATPAYTSVDPLVPSTGLPGMQFHEMAVELPATWAGPVDDFTVLFCMRGGATAVNQVFARVPSTATTPGWRIRATGAGTQIQAEFFAPGGAFVVATSPIPATGMVRLQVEGGVAATLAITDANGTKQTTTLTSGSIPTGFDGSPRFGSDANTLTPAMAEMAYWSGQVVSTSILDGLGQVMAGNGWGLVPTLDLRIAAYQALAGSTSTVEIHPSSLPQLTAVDAMPATLAEGYRAGADAGRGVTYALRDGTIRVRTVEALTDPTLAAHYSTAVANLTDEPSPSGSPTPVRRSPVKFSGVRSGEVVNASVVTYRSWGGEARVVAEDPVSIARFGRRERSFSSDWAAAEGSAMQAIADADVARYSWPRRRMDALTIQPLLDGVLGADDAIDFVVDDLELERAVDVTWTPQGGSPVTETLQVQGISWDWSPSQWTVTLALAES